MAEKWLNANTILSVVVVGALMFTLFDAPQHREDRLRQMEMRLASLETMTLHRIAQLEAEEIPPPEQKAFNRTIRGDVDSLAINIASRFDAMDERLSRVLQRLHSIATTSFHRHEQEIQGHPGEGTRP